MVKRVTGTLCAVLLLAAFAGAAQAGNGNGNGNSDAAPTEQAAAPGNSAEAPGQAKKDAEPQADAKQTGQDKKASAPSVQESAPAASAASEGVKPSNSTAKNTDAPANSNRTKKYGNGKTAGQIAIQHGYPESGNLHGPGNSQPHKVVTCGHRHGVDVHAIKSHPAKGCGSAPNPVPPAHRPEPPTTNEPPVVTPPASPSGPGSKPVHDPGKQPEPGPKTTTTSTTHGTAAFQAMSGVLVATAAVGGSTLPFTGFPLWAVALAALALVGAGLALRRLA
jgi:hypothetical protein